MSKCLAQSYLYAKVPYIHFFAEHTKTIQPAIIYLQLNK